MLLQYATCCYIGFIPCAAFESRDRYANVFAVSMKKLVIAHIYAHMVDDAVTIRIGENQIASLQI